MRTRMSLKTCKVSHAIAYVDTFMMSFDPDDSELKKIFEQAHDLTAPDVVSIIKVSVQQNNPYGADIILKEMDDEQFERYIARKLAFFRDSLMDREED